MPSVFMCNNCCSHSHNMYHNMRFRHWNILLSLDNIFNLWGLRHLPDHLCHVLSIKMQGFNHLLVWGNFFCKLNYSLFKNYICITKRNVSIHIFHIINQIHVYKFNFLKKWSFQYNFVTFDIIILFCSLYILSLIFV